MSKKPTSGPGFRKPCARLDVHAHLGRPGNTLHIFTAEERIAFDAFLDADKCVVMTMPEPNVPNAPETITGEEACAICRAYPDHFVWLCNVNPDGTQATYDALKAYKAMGAKGLGEFMDLKRFDDPAIDHMLACCEELDMPVLFHLSPDGTGYGVIDEPGLPLLEKALRAHPRLTFIGHSQPFWSEMSDMGGNTSADARNAYPSGKVVPGRVPYLLETYPNLYADLSADSGGNALLRDEEYAIEFLNKFQDKLLFGSDIANTGFIYPLAFYLDSLLHQGKISEEVYVKVCRGNAERVLGI